MPNLLSSQSTQSVLYKVPSKLFYTKLTLFVCLECVLKLPTDNDATESDSSSSISTIGLSANQVGPSTPSGYKTGRNQDGAPPGYVASLIQKIISNVTIVCNNLILKYVEEDIVLSLNVRNLKLCSANEIWEPAWTELTLPDLILRKLLKITDMTICLDKRNASGKIDTYQEPLLYRCSLAIHAAWCYDSIHSKVPTISRYEGKCPKLDFSLTDTQIPMFMRIANLAFALYMGEIVQKAKRKKTKPSDDTVLQMEDHEDPIDEGQNESWGGWAWSVGSSVGSALLPVYWEDEDEVDVPKLDAARNKIVHFGVFIDAASLVLKLTEHQSVDKSMFGSMKLCFTPFARIDCSGIYSEVIVRGMGLVNVAAGLSEVMVVPMGHCLCGKLDTKAPNTSEVEVPYVQCGQSGGKKYLKGSLFEKDFGAEEGQNPKERRRSNDIDWESHMDQVTEAKMLGEVACTSSRLHVCLVNTR